ncbi:flagellar transcriptional regulator FlhD [Salinisphaera sp.]|uniref:flagellar transcriptional regulator FlhD n=1 Tax=Salinisphaera sp. TaxID=1914330 RepID=UPI002D7707AD|nr:flagellar transcriptional regulator FlhD [Salinisphaera sp.]HET7313521.1 flagellar transcriptional regulator FlhD [Salinisphaera sp.]
METDHLLDDIREVNLSYLLLMQRLINTDREAAMFRLKIDDEMADLLSRIPVSELVRLARCNQLLCHFSLQDADQLHSLVRANSDDRMRQVHAAILLGSNERRAANDRRQSERRQGERRQGDRRIHDQGPPDGVERRVEERRQDERRGAEDRRQGPRRAADRAEEGDTRKEHRGADGRHG